MVPSISKEELKKIYQNGDVHVLDVREKEEVAQGMIPGALNLPVSEFTDRIDELDKDSKYYVVCRTSRRSSAIAEQLNDKGYDATVLAEGMQGWDGETE